MCPLLGLAIRKRIGRNPPKADTWRYDSERQLGPDTVEKLSLIVGPVADSVFPLIWELVRDDGAEKGSAGGAVL